MFLIYFFINQRLLRMVVYNNICSAFSANSELRSIKENIILRFLREKFLLKFAVSNTLQAVFFPRNSQKNTLLTYLYFMIRKKRRTSAHSANSELRSIKENIILPFLREKFLLKFRSL